MTDQFLKSRTIVFSLITVSLISFLYYTFSFPNVLETRRLNVPKGRNFNTVISMLTQDDYLKNPFTLKIVSHLSPTTKSVKRGSYLLNKGLNNWQILNILRKGLQVPVNFTISTANNKEDLVDQVCKKLDISTEELRELLDSTVFTLEYGFNPKNILALFIANTYKIYWTITAKEFISRMHLEYKNFWNKDRLEKASSIKLTPIEVTILASIVQLETNKLSEAPIIAGIYINRLRRGIPLCACPTIKHIIKAEKKVNRVLKKDTLVDSEFNTYKRRGLPPGPLCLPSTKYIDAVLNYEKHGYFYFSSKEDFSGYHYFAKTLIEHNRNAARYRQKLNESRIFR